MTLEHLELKDPQRLMDALVRRQPLHEGDVWLVLVDEPSTRQQILDLRRLRTGASPEDRRELSDLLHDTMHSLKIPPRGRHFRAVVVTVIVRRGSNVWGPSEKLWAMAWRYSNHNTDAPDTEIFVVTEHGWAALGAHDGGADPRLEDERPVAC